MNSSFQENGIMTNVNGSHCRTNGNTTTTNNNNNPIRLILKKIHLRSYKSQRIVRETLTTFLTTIFF